MQALQLIPTIIAAKKAEEIFTICSFRKEYADLIKLLHPDVCALPLAGEAVAKLNGFRKEMEKYTQGEDDAGAFTITAENEIVFSGERDLLQQSYQHYQMLMQLNDEAANHFKKYLPQSMALTGNELRVSTHQRAVPLTHLTLPHTHTNWILSRVLEFISWLHQLGYCHLGINPESIFIVPETHGIICISFYHLTKTKAKPATLSGHYLNWYPAIVFDQKKALPYIDLSLAQRLAIYVLGDKSGNGIVLKKTEHPTLIDFLITPHYDSFQTYQDFRQLLLQLFGKPSFHPLNI